jgi:glucose/arabinose dehydrogenase
VVRRIVNLALFGAIALAVVLGLLWAFRGEALRLFGISFDSGSAAETALQVPEGYRAGIFADGLGAPRFMAVSPDGDLFVADPGAGEVVALPDRDGDGQADQAVVVGEGYDAAHSLAFEADGSLLVAGNGTLYRLTLDESLREASREELATYPRGGQHSTRTVVVTADGSILLSLGSSCNVCWEEDPRRASIFSITPDGREWQVVMRGLRNAVGVAIDPATGMAWATNNGRDMLGDDLPPETLYRVVQGADAGWPRCHAGDLVDPDFGTQPDPASGAVGCEGVADPAATFQAHMAPLGVAFWEDHAVIAFHGSWNRSSKVGYELRWLPWDDGPTGPDEVLAGGFLDDASGDASGRPAGVIVSVDGALYVSDDKGGYVFRIARSG